MSSSQELIYLCISADSYRTRGSDDLLMVFKDKTKAIEHKKRIEGDDCIEALILVFDIKTSTRLGFLNEDTGDIIVIMPAIRDSNGKAMYYQQ